MWALKVAPKDSMIVSVMAEEAKRVIGVCVDHLEEPIIQQKHDPIQFPITIYQNHSIFLPDAHPPFPHPAFNLRNLPL